MAELIKGEEISLDIKKEIAEEAEEFKKTKKLIPGLAVILVGEDPASKLYVSNKQKSCDEVGFHSETLKMDESVSTEDILNELQNLNKRDDIHGILVQLPLPPHIDKGRVLESIRPDKDVDGFHPVNVGKLITQQDCLVSATPSGIIEILKRKNIKIKGKNATIIGRSTMVGKPTALLLLNEQATVTICHTKTRDLKSSTLGADIIVAAAGVPYLVKGDMVREGVVVIDVGINRITKDEASSELLEWRKEDFETKGYTLIGDVDFLMVEPKASFITPVPGGVGPVTIAMLLKNTLKAAKMQTVKDK